MRVCVETRSGGIHTSPLRGLGDVAHVWPQALLSHFTKANLIPCCYTDPTQQTVRTAHRGRGSPPCRVLQGSRCPRHTTLEVGERRASTQTQHMASQHSTCPSRAMQRQATAASQPPPGRIFCNMNHPHHKCITNLHLWMFVIAKLHK